MMEYPKWNRSTKRTVGLMQSSVTCSTDGRWMLERLYARDWYVYLDGELWGEWDDTDGGRQYAPFKSRREALTTIDHHIEKGAVV